ncbi:MAG: hypothetical protein ABJK25_14450 [Halieaceae bacterium]
MTVITNAQSLARHTEIPSNPLPTHKARLYRIPETHYVRRQRAANQPTYVIPRPIAPRLPSSPPGYWSRELEKFSAASTQAWIDLKATSRRLIHRAMRWIVIPMALISGFGIFAAEPAELPDSRFQDAPYRQAIHEAP